MDLITAWFCVIAAFWVGFLVLEGFDFGVGFWSFLLGRDEEQRGTYLGTIGPVWDANEVWMVVAIGAMFAAFPGWYATMLSAFYLPLIAVLLLLIARGIALEWRGKHDAPYWRRRCDVLLCVSSATIPFCWGYVLAGMTHGLPLDASGTRVGGPATLVDTYALVGGFATVALCLLHGGLFLQLRTRGRLRRTARSASRKILLPTLAVLALWWWMTVQLPGTTSIGTALVTVAAAAVVVSLWASQTNRDGWAFAGTTVVIGCSVAALFAAIYPLAMPSTLGHHLSLGDAAAGNYALSILSWVAAFLLPAVLAYQGWAYWVFRRRVSHERIDADEHRDRLSGVDSSRLDPQSAKTHDAEPPSSQDEDSENARAHTKRAPCAGDCHEAH